MIDCSFRRTNHIFKGGIRGLIFCFHRLNIRLSTNLIMSMRVRAKVEFVYQLVFTVIIYFFFFQDRPLLL